MHANVEGPRRFLPLPLSLGTYLSLALDISDIPCGLTRSYRRSSAYYFFVVKLFYPNGKYIPHFQNSRKRRRRRAGGRAGVFRRLLAGSTQQDPGGGVTFLLSKPLPPCPLRRWARGEEHRCKVRNHFKREKCTEKTVNLFIPLFYYVHIKTILKTCMRIKIK